MFGARRNGGRQIANMSKCLPKNSNMPLTIVAILAPGVRAGHRVDGLLDRCSEFSARPDRQAE